MASLGLEFLRFLDGQDRMKHEVRHQRFEQPSPAPEFLDLQDLPATSDADVDFDYSGVAWEAPSENEVALLQKMLSDNSVTLPGAAFPAEEPKYELPDAPLDEDEIDNDREWV